VKAINYIVVVLLLCLSSIANADGRLYSYLDIEASSEPVPISDMIDGWDSAYQKGDYAYANASAVVGIDVNGWILEQETRRYYYLTFSPDTAAWYRDLDQGNQRTTRDQIELSAKVLEAQGLRFGYHFEGKRWQITPKLAVYKVGHFQFGQLNGVSFDGTGRNVSIELDSYFDEDKILNYEANVPEGAGLSLSIAGEWQFNDQWVVSYELNDLLNRWTFEDAAFNKGCVNLGHVDETVCSSSSSASGLSGQEKLITTIPVNSKARLTYQPLGLSLAGTMHGRYERLSLAKYWSVDNVNLGVSVYSSNQLGLHVHNRYFQLDVVSDDRRIHYARDAEVTLGISLPW
jgi:hypothetical protein